jgi:hypothetical protein
MSLVGADQRRSLADPGPICSLRRARGPSAQHRRLEDGRMAKDHVICFVEGTQVLTATSASATGIDDAAGRNIEQVEVGDLVWARDEQTGEEGYKPVVQVFENTTDTLVHLTYTSSGSNETTLTGTPGHPFWSVDQGDWVGMHELRPGETLLLTAGRTATVTNTRTEHLTTPAKIYNFEVADWHTYHVGSDTGWVWVHNRNCGETIEQIKSVRRANHSKKWVENHHIVPHGGKSNKLRNHGLVRAAGIDLKTYSRNIMPLGNHRGRHTGAYRQGVLDELDSQYRAFLAAGGTNARWYLNSALDNLAYQINSGGLALNRRRVWPVR